MDVFFILLLHWLVTLTNSPSPCGMMRRVKMISI